MTERKWVPHLLSEDGNRPVTVNELCLALGMMMHQTRPDRSGSGLVDAMIYANLLKMPLDLPRDMYELIINMER